MVTLSQSVMNTRRRQLLLAGAGGLALLPLGLWCNVSSTTRLFSACTDFNNQHYISALLDRGEVDFLIPIPARAHDSVYLPELGHAVFCSRRPGNALYVVDVKTKHLIATINLPQHRYACGHGSANGRYLYTSEADAGSHQGVIGVYDSTQSYQR
ncbi:MAG: DUF1513 domain-containing protein, partial [Pseudomonadota bacterium]